jgi:hypothetical protein
MSTAGRQWKRAHLGFIPDLTHTMMRGIMIAGHTTTIANSDLRLPKALPDFAVAEGLDGSPQFFHGDASDTVRLP